MIDGGKPSPLRLIFIYFYFRGMLATFAYHKQFCVSVTPRDDAKQSFSRTVQPAVNLVRAVVHERRDTLVNVLPDADSGRGSEKPTIDIPPEKPASEEPTISASSRISRQSVLVAGGLVVLIAIAFASWRWTAGARPGTSQQRARGSVVLIRAFDAADKAIATGSGFFISADGKLVTNYHVIKGASKLVVKLENGAMHEVSGVLADDSKSDIVLLRVEASGLPFLRLGDSASAQVGQRVTVIGSPLGLEGTMSDGIISAKRALPGKEKWLQITAPIAPGSSGSPVLDANNDVLGVATMIMRGGQALNFAVPIESAKALLAEVGSRSEAKPLEGIPRREQNIARDDTEYRELLAALESGDYVRAAKLMQSLEKRFPQSAPQFHKFRGMIFYGVKLHKEAIKEFEQAVKFQPDDAAVWFVLGATHAQNGGYHEAIKAYQRALVIEPDSLAGQRALKSAYQRLGISYNRQDATD